MSVSDTVAAFTQPTTYTATSVALVTSTTTTTTDIPWVALVSLGIALVSVVINWYYKHKDSKEFHRKSD
jgi:H+/Cl- antiporter ClcA